MSFIQPDEHIVIMDYIQYPPCEAFTNDDLARLHDAGIKTIMCYLRWDRAEPEMGVYDWSQIDEEVARIRAAGMKTIVKVYLCTPTYFPEDRYARKANGKVHNTFGAADAMGDPSDWSLISYWNPDVWAHHLQFIERACKHYTAEDVLCINIAPANGESLIFGDGCFYDKCAIESYQKFAGDNSLPVENAVPGTQTLDWLRATTIPAQIETQRIFHKYGHEYWTMLHHAFETIPSTGNWLIDDLYCALHKELGDEHWGICYTVFRPGETRGLWGPEQDIKRHGVKMLFGAEGAEGLLRNTQRAIQMGARAMMAGPLAPYLGHKHMEDWMYSAIRTSNRWWEGK